MDYQKEINIHFQQIEKLKESLEEVRINFEREGMNKLKTELFNVMGDLAMKLWYEFYRLILI